MLIGTSKTLKQLQ